MKYLFYLLILLTPLSLLAQEDEERTYEEDETENVSEDFSTKELGIDLNLSASTLGGTGGVGLKLGFLPEQYLVVGPSIRYQHSWSSLNGVKTGFSVYGGGAFAHLRAYKYLFAGLEIEMLSSPIQNGYLSTQRSWVPVVLVGGGFSGALGPYVRLNAGVMIDVVDHQNSPLRQGYFLRNKQGVLLPVLYRVAFFFSL